MQQPDPFDENATYFSYYCVFYIYNTPSMPSDWADIGGNFYMDREGQVYEGRGYYYKAAYLTGLVGGDPYGNHLSITLFGNYTTEIPPPEALASLRAFCACAVENGMLYSNYTVLGHSEDLAIGYECRGQAFIDLLHEWPVLN